MALTKSKSLQEARASIRAVLHEELGRNVLLSERAAIVFENLFFDSDFKSWQLKMLNTIFQTTPATFSQIVDFAPIYSKFDYVKLSKKVSTFQGRSPSTKITDFRGIVHQLFSELGLLRKNGQ